MIRFTLTVARMKKPKKIKTNLPPPPKFTKLEKTTAELVAACQRGIDAARQLTNPYYRA